jgi:putative phosphoribosyl transferase
MDTVFHDRTEAGRLLARELKRYAGRGDVIVLALPRGGVPVGYEVASALGLPLDVFVVRKLGVPGFEELAMGAIASGGTRVVNEEVVRRWPEKAAMLDKVAAEEMVELQRREKLYRGERHALDVAGKTVLLVDDGLATGSTARAAIAALRKLGCARIVLAVPVGAASTRAELRLEADDVVCLSAPEDFGAVGRFYEDFSQTTDREVCDLLAAANASATSA